MRFSPALVFLLLMFLPAPLGTIRLRISEHECAAPCTLTATVAIPTHPDNRRASVAWGDDTSESIDWPLGPDASVEFDVTVKNLPRGTHIVCTPSSSGSD